MGIVTTEPSELPDAAQHYSRPVARDAWRLHDLDIPRALDKPLTNADIDDVHPEVATRVLDLAMRVGELLLSSATPANDVVVSMLRLCHAFGLTTVHADVSYTAITLSYFRGVDRPPVTSTRVVETPAADYTVVERIERFMLWLEEHRVSLKAAEARFYHLMSGPRPYPRWVTMVGTALVGVGAVTIWGAGWQAMVITFLIGLVTWNLIHFLGRHHVPPFFNQFAASTVITLLATLFWWTGTQVHWVDGGANPDLVITGGIIMLVVGNTAVGAAQDAIDEFYLTAAARAIEVAMMTGGILCGLITGIQVAHWLGATPPVTTEFLTYGPPWMQLVGAFVVAGMYGFETNSGWKTVAFAALAGLVGWVGYTLAHGWGWADLTANALGALFAALLGSALAHQFRVPVVSVVSSALIPLVPGSMLVTAMKQMFGLRLDLSQMQTGTFTLIEAVALSLGIAIGATAGIYITRPSREHLRRIQARLSVRRSLRLTWFIRRGVDRYTKERPETSGKTAR